MKVLVFDTETTPIKGYTWGTYQTDVIEVIEDWQIICFAYKWLGEDQVFFERGGKNPWNDKKMIKKLWGLFDEADVIIAHNLKRFDLKKSNAMFLRHGLKPPSPSKYIDTLQVARSQFALTSNKLDRLGESLGLGRKVQHEGFMSLFKGCMLDNSPESWEKMEEYNIQDVVLLEEVYKVLMPWVKNHPVDLERGGCLTCGSYNIDKRGFKDTNAYRYQRYRCRDCGKWMAGERIYIDKPKLKNI